MNLESLERKASSMSHQYPWTLKYLSVIATIHLILFVMDLTNVL